MWSWRPRPRSEEGRPAAPARRVPEGLRRAADTDRSPLAGPIPGVAAPGAGAGMTRLSCELRRLLGVLGATTGEIAETLECAGVRAVPRDERATPVSLYLRAVIGADPHVKAVVVDQHRVVVELGAWWRPTVEVDLPPVVREFTTAFDERCYPALLAPGGTGQTSGHG